MQRRIGGRLPQTPRSLPFAALRRGGAFHFRRPWRLPAFCIKHFAPCYPVKCLKYFHKAVMNMPSFFCKIIHVETKVIPQFFLFMILLYMRKSRGFPAAFVCLGRGKEEYAFTLSGDAVLNFFCRSCVRFAYKRLIFSPCRLKICLYFSYCFCYNTINNLYFRL